MPEILSCIERYTSGMPGIVLETCMYANVMVIPICNMYCCYVYVIKCVGYFMSGGLHRDRIALELKHFPRKRVLGCLDKMVDNSSLYQVDTNTYKIT